MSLFVIVCGALVLLSALFYLRPFRRGSAADQELDRANLEWYRLREVELAETGDEDLREDARLRLLEDDQQAAGDGSVAAGGSRSFPLWLLLPLVAFASSALYYYLGAAADVEISRKLQQFDEESSEQDMRLLIDAIEARSTQRPDNLHYVALLGRYYMGQRDYGRAADTYGALAEESPQDAQALAYAAQAEFLAAGRVLSDDARMKAEQLAAAQCFVCNAAGVSKPHNRLKVWLNSRVTE